MLTSDGFRCDLTESSSNMARSLAVIVLNWNRKDDTLRCLASIERSSHASFDTIVVDNASSDDSVQAIRETFPTVRIMQNRTNLGYAGGNNVGLETALADGYEYILLLNNDTIVDPLAFERLVSLAEREPKTGIVAPSIFYLDDPKRVWSAGGTIDWQRGIVETSYFNAPESALPTKPYAADHVTGCCLLLRAEALRTAGLIDQRFFLYFEETEWCVRIARSGHQILVEPAAHIWHAIRPDEQSGSPAIAYYMTRNQLLFFNLTGAPVMTRARASVRQLRTLLSLYLRPHSAARIRGRQPMLRAIWDHMRGHYGPAPIAW
jgi:GT2 family glycosyltransferase